MTSRAWAVAAVAAALALAGCQDPYANHRLGPAPSVTTTVTPDRGDVARPGPRAAPPLAARVHAGDSARESARVFATRWTNWDWRMAARQQRSLARLAVGELARRLEANAASARIDASLARDRPGSRGRVAAIQISIHGRRAAGLVVVHEQTFTGNRADLGGRRYRVYLIRLSGGHGHWAVSGWEPQP